MSKGLGEVYSKAIEKNFPQRAVWRPGRTMKLGDYGVLIKRGLFRRYFSRRGNIEKDLGIKFRTEKDDSPTKFQKFCSRSGLKFMPKSKGKLGLGGVKFAGVGVSLSFAHTETVFIDAHDCYYDEIADIDALERKIIKAYDKGRGKWKKEYLLVTHIERAEGATILITIGDKAEIDIEAKAAGPIKFISDPSLGLEVKYSSNLGYEMVAKKGLKLMMETMGIRFRKRKGKKKVPVLETILD
jgi:hypothetical protein